jgi:hypothetical protein
LNHYKKKWAFEKTMPDLRQLIDIRNNILCLRFEQMKREYQKLLNIHHACATLKSRSQTEKQLQLKFQVMAHEMQQLLHQDTEMVLPEDAPTFQQLLESAGQTI